MADQPRPDGQSTAGTTRPSSATDEVAGRVGLSVTSGPRPVVSDAAGVSDAVRIDLSALAAGWGHPHAGRGATVSPDASDEDDTAAQLDSPVDRGDVAWTTVAPEDRQETALMPDERDLDRTALMRGRSDADQTALVSRAGQRTMPIPGDEQRSVPLPTGADMARWATRSGTFPLVEAALPQAPPAVPPVRKPVPPPTGPGPVRRPWMLPLAAGALAVVLLSVLGFGVLLIYRALDGRPATSRPTTSDDPLASASVIAPVDEGSFGPSTTPSELPSESAGSTTPSVVVIPVVRGFTADAASRTLSGLGLTVRVRQRDDTTVPAGTVAGTDPAEGSVVVPGSAVTLTVARAPVSPSASGASRTTAASSAAPSASPSTPR